MVIGGNLNARNIIFFLFNFFCFALLVSFPSFFFTFWSLSGNYDSQIKINEGIITINIILENRFGQWYDCFCVGIKKGVVSLCLLPFILRFFFQAKILNKQKISSTNDKNRWNYIFKCYRSFLWLFPVFYFFGFPSVTIITWNNFLIKKVRPFIFLINLSFRENCCTNEDYRNWNGAKFINLLACSLLYKRLKSPRWYKLYIARSNGNIIFFLDSLIKRHNILMMKWEARYSFFLQFFFWGLKIY